MICTLATVINPQLLKMAHNRMKPKMVTWVIFHIYFNFVNFIKFFETISFFIICFFCSLCFFIIFVLADADIGDDAGKANDGQYLSRSSNL